MVSRGRRNFEIVSQRRKSSCLHFYYGGPSILRAIFRQLFEVNKTSSLVVFSWVESIGVCSPVESLLGPHWPLL